MQFLKITLLAIAATMTPSAIACKCISNGFNAVDEGTKPCCDQAHGTFEFDDCSYDSLGPKLGKDSFNFCCEQRNFGWDC